jgi:hypothetical protein
MRNKTILLATLLLFTVLSYGLDPPVKLWERQYSFPGGSGCFFYDVELTPENNLFISGVSRDFQNPDSTGYCAFLIDLDGNNIWQVDFTCLLMSGADGVILPDGSMAITGYCFTDMEGSHALFIMKIAQDGSTEWTRIYDYPDTREEGYGITCLPDGGFAVC